jgi:isoleucyl-tRNA synthetase
MRINRIILLVLLIGVGSGMALRLLSGRVHIMQRVHGNARVGRQLYLRMVASETKGAAKGKAKKEKSPYSATVILPQTGFDQRANAAKKEPEIQKWWSENRIYEKLSEENAGSKFVLHDGPPYANGDLHIGHALNKILKDFINKYQLLKGRKVRYVPGWDCHGLPIELKVLQSIKSKERQELTPIKLRKLAAGFARETVEKQASSFKRYGIWGNWDQPYLTLQPEYEAEQIRVFGQMVQNGHIYRGRKPVHWSPSSQTALAEAELEYPDNHISRSIYVGLPVISVSDALSKTNVDNLHIAIWTTTPWTMPANMAVAVGESITYSVAVSPEGKRFLVAEDLKDALGEKMKSTLMTEATFKGSDLIGTKYQHPLYDRQSEIVLGGDYITTDSGTGLVHTAPGHGQEDYLTGLKYGLELLSPVNALGKFTEEAGSEFAGMSVLGDGNEAVIQALIRENALIAEEAYNHKYPYDWRTKKPTIFRATEQWFASVSNFREDALKAIDQVKWIPAIGRNRIYSMTEGRGDWCISRQRSWGVPIPVFYHKETNEPLMTPATLKHIEDLFRERGSDSWWELDTADLLPLDLRGEAGNYVKGTDTMDVWFDSGTSWAGVVNARDDLAYPADVYLEGSDQHRGWFQSSLLTSVASQGQAPYKSVLTHGFVLDEKGFKMSKSLGNVVDPKKIIEGGGNQKKEPAYGADTLRLWISSVDYSGDVCIGGNIMKQQSDSYRKLRNTLRYLVGNLADFNPINNAVPIDQLPSLDRYMLGELSRITSEIEEAYDEYQFYKANQVLFNFANLDLSSFYLDIAKDRLYISARDDFRRRSCQTVLQTLLEHLTIAMSPIVPHMAEDCWANIPYDKGCSSVFEKGWMNTKSFPAHNARKWAAIRSLRDNVNKCIELARTAKTIGASSEAQVFIHIPAGREDGLAETVATMNHEDTFSMNGDNARTVDNLQFLLLVSKVTLMDSDTAVKMECSDFQVTTDSGIVIGVRNADGPKCDRCWYYTDDVGYDEDHATVCPRCAAAVKTDGHEVDLTPRVPTSD